ncbi:MAG: menaquinone biosynthesis protein [Prevotellaceae bacterium]|jgi:chorismate dehydratase|nr:menaquinone biosynthesis protein [Prevotellaceae bacterium]
MKKIKVSVISYLNTSPFVYGLKHSEIIDYIDLRYNTPAECAVSLLNKDADLGIVPAAVVPQIPDRQIISDYCIGASGNVRSVVICSNLPVSEIKTLYLDFESCTSVLLARLLLDDYWKINVHPVRLNSLSDINPDREDSAYVLIGDKVFDYEDKFKYRTDLAQAWKDFTGLPFVFAAWTAVTPLSNDFIAMFNSALTMGLANIPAAISEHRHTPDYRDAVKYLTENIDYNFDFMKRKALVKFWNMVLKLRSKYRSC